MPFVCQYCMNYYCLLTYSTHLKSKINNKILINAPNSMKQFINYN